jgi:hypothetical protein
MMVTRLSYESSMVHNLCTIRNQPKKVELNFIHLLNSALYLQNENSQKVKKATTYILNMLYSHENICKYLESNYTRQAIYGAYNITLMCVCVTIAVVEKQ